MFADRGVRIVLVHCPGPGKRRVYSGRCRDESETSTLHPLTRENERIPFSDQVFISLYYTKKLFLGKKCGPMDVGCGREKIGPEEGRGPLGRWRRPDHR